MLYLIFLFFMMFVGVYISVWFLLVALSNANRLHEKISSHYSPTVSVLVPAHNEEKHINKSLESIANLEYPKKKIEIVVIDNGSADKTSEKAENFRKKFSKRLKKIKLIKLPNPSKTDALNAGLKHATGEIIGILDADTFVSKDCLKKMMPYFEDKRVGAVTNYVKPSPAKGIFASLQDIEYIFSSFSKKIISLLDSLYIIPGTMSLIRKDIIKKIGFPEDTLTEDMDIALCMLKRGYKIANSLDAVAYTVVPSTFLGLFKQRMRWYRGFMQNLAKHSDIMFNKKYPHLGYFVFPFSSIIAIFVGISLTMILLSNITRSAIIFLKRAFYIPIPDTIPLFTTIPLKTLSISKLFMDPYSRILYTMIFVSTVIAVVVALRLQKIRIRGRILMLPIYFFIYYVLIMIFWFVSVFTELFKLKKKW